MDSDQARALYGPAYAGLYDGLWEESPTWAPEAQLHVDWLASCMDASTRWLDVGCGTGWILSQFPDVDRAGIDLSPAMLARAQAVNPGVSFREGDIRDDIPEWFDAWDLVSSTGQAWSYVESISEVERIAENMARWTAPTGTLFVQPPDICDLTGVVIPYNFSGEASANGSVAVTAAMWTYHDEGGAHENLIFPSLDVWVRWLSRWFHRVEVHTWPKQPEFLPVNRKVVLAKGKRQTDELSPTVVVLHPHPDEPEGTLPHSFESAIAPAPLTPTGRTGRGRGGEGLGARARQRAVALRPPRWRGIRRRVRRRLRPLAPLARRARTAVHRARRAARRRTVGRSESTAADARAPEVGELPAPGAGPTRTTIRVGSLTFDATIQGPQDGVPVVLLHGYPESSWQWRCVQPQLAARGFRTVAPDLRGYSPGARPPDVADYRAEELVADVLGLADHLGFDRFHLVGHDWGGALAWHVAGRHPGRVQTLTVLSTPHPLAFVHAEQAGPQPDGQDQAAMTAYMHELARPGHEHTILADGGRGMRRSLEQSGMPPETAARYVRDASDPEALAGRLRWYAGFDWTDVTGQGPIQVPTLYVWSTGDPVLGRLAAERTADHVAAPYRFEVLEGVSHWIAEEAPDELVELLLDHLGD